jgi:hypothetical protein
VLVEFGLDALADAWLVLLLIRRTVVLAAGVRLGLGVIWASALAKMNALLLHQAWQSLVTTKHYTCRL